MKHVLILLPVIFCFGFIDAPSFTASVHPGKDASFIVELDNPKKERLYVSIRHAQYGVLSDTTVSSDKFRCRYNLRDVEDGQLMLEISNGKQQLVQKFTMQTETKIERTINIETAIEAKKAF